MEEPREDSRRLAAVLRDLRNKAGLSTYQLSQALGWSQTKVSKVERGQSVADPDDVTAWAAAVGVPDVRAAELAATAAAVADEMKSWRAVHGRGLADTQRQLQERHAALTGYREFAPYAVPGFLQTNAYAERVLDLADVSGRRDVREAAAERLRTQDALAKNGKSFRFLLSEAALHLRFGDAETMTAQAEKIITAGQSPNVTVSVVPFSAQSMALQYSGFGIYDMPDGPLILVELHTRELKLRSAWDVRVYEQTFARLQAVALSGRDASALIRAAMTG